MRVRHSPKSQRDIQEIGRYLRAHNPAAALKVRGEIQDALLLIARRPGAGSPVGRGLRRFALPRLPYVIVYRIDEQAEEVQVATIRHTSRQPIV